MIPPCVDWLLQQLINGLALGFIYALVALGYTMVYGILRFINFAHSDVLMLGAFSAYFLAPARCGMWLSRGRMGAIARGLGLALPFGPRAEVAEALFAAAGSAGVSLNLIRVLDDELSAWDRGYDRQPPGLGWSLNGHWQARIYAAEGQLNEMRQGLQLQG